MVSVDILKGVTEIRKYVDQGVLHSLSLFLSHWPRHKLGAWSNYLSHGRYTIEAVLLDLNGHMCHVIEETIWDFPKKYQKIFFLRTTVRCMA